MISSSESMVSKAGMKEFNLFSLVKGKMKMGYDNRLQMHKRLLQGGWWLIVSISVINRMWTN